MEFPIVSQLRLPKTAQRIITQLLREPHPTAALIKNLDFEYEDCPEVLPSVYVSGEGVRFIDRDTCPPRYVTMHPTYLPFEFGGWAITFSYSPDTGEPLLAD